MQQKENLVNCLTPISGYVLIICQAKPYLEKAMKLDPTYLDAVYIMADIYAQEHDHERGITLLV